MTKPFKSDDRPSDTKSVVLNKVSDARLLEHLAQLKGQTESQRWRKALNFDLDFMAWIVTIPGAPEPNLPFVYYRAWLEQRLAAERSSAPLQPLDADALAAAMLPGVRTVVEAALSTALAGWSGRAGAPATGGGVEVLELADLLSSELVLE